MASSIIKSIKARKVVDSRGNWTIETDVITSNGHGRCTAPSGASTGKFEVHSYPNGNVDQAITKFENELAPVLIGMDVDNQELIDQTLKDIDGTSNFSNIGGNTSVVISLAAAKASSSSNGVPLYQHLGQNPNSIPYPLGNIIGGGAHASNSTDIQEFLIIPVGASDLHEALWINNEVHKRVKVELLSKGKNMSLGKGDEGAWAPNIGDEEALEVLVKITSEVKDEVGIDIKLGVDVASSEMWDSDLERYVYQREGVKRTSEEQVNHILDLIEAFDLYYVEDPVEEEDFEGFTEITNGSKALVCGDDLYVTNIKRIQKGVNLGSTRALLVKPNQIGTLTDTFKAIELANKNRLTTVLSHRSGESSDETIAHLAVAYECPIIKTGVVGGERIAKLNELIRIEEDLGIRAKMAHLPI
jgi:enolase